MKETELDENGESRQVIEPGDDDGGNQPDERIGVGASIDSITVSVQIQFGLDPPVKLSSEYHVLCYIYARGSIYHECEPLCFKYTSRVL